MLLVLAGIRVIAMRLDLQIKINRDFDFSIFVWYQDGRMQRPTPIWKRGIKKKPSSEKKTFFRVTSTYCIHSNGMEVVIPSPESNADGSTCFWRYFEQTCFQRCVTCLLQLARISRLGWQWSIIVSFLEKNNKNKQGRMHGIRCVLARTDSSFGQKRHYTL